MATARGFSISFVRYCRCACVALTASSISSASVHAEPPRSNPARIVLPAGSLRIALDALARQTGISIGMAGALPDTPPRKTTRASNVAQALKRLLAGTHLRAVQIDVATWRIEPLPRRPDSPHAVAPPIIEGGDIIVTASKRDERLSDLPASISILGGPSLDRLAGKRGLVDLLATTDGAFSTNLGPGRDRVFLRGVADSAFNGTSQSLVSLYLDDARIGYSSPDPDLRMVDIDRVEILRGPQGTLYGTGALGGVIRIVTAAPELDDVSGSVAGEATGINNGAFGGALDATLNLPIVTGTLALRASGWTETMPGWIDDTGRDKSDVNRTTRRGGRAALRWAISNGWSATASAVAQSIEARDSQYATKGLARATALAEPQDNDFVSGSLDVHGPIGSLDAQSTTSIVSHEFGSTYDASILAGALGTAAPVAYVEDRAIRLLTQEVRLSDPMARHPWIVGASILHATTRLKGRFETDATRAIARDDKEAVFEAAMFAEGTQRLSSALDLKIGLRGFVTVNDIEQQGPDEQSTTKLGITPSGTLSWHRDDAGMVWLRYASAIRPAGVTRATISNERRIPGDELQSIELGWRIRGLDDRLSLSGAIFGSVWEHLRSDVVGSDGLFGTVDAGDATNYGVEFGGRFDAEPYMIDFGTTIQRARLTSPATERTEQVDRRLPVVPDYSARLSVTRRFALNAIPTRGYVTVRYIGQTRLSFDPLLDRPAGDYATLGAGATLDDGARHWSVTVDNLLDGRGNSFGFGNPFTLATTTQTVPIRPRSITLRLAIGL
ncbi:TonB-dependent receptor [Sphingomonas sp. Leaf38]|uniref:TonB-dependent receptor n=1 Tax=Sphingomonas sp. Leaf38 TaxID=1736217 RepID=UPI00138EDDC3|nr:TonB-dependent receptor [Sphingomonas sp. Leaf38]